LPGRARWATACTAQVGVLNTLLKVCHARGSLAQPATLGCTAGAADQLVSATDAGADLVGVMVEEFTRGAIQKGAFKVEYPGVVTSVAKSQCAAAAAAVNGAVLSFLGGTFRRCEISTHTTSGTS
jgi:hypothetical protein